MSYGIKESPEAEDISQSSGKDAVFVPDIVIEAETGKEDPREIQP